jgi:hypothetical protein
MSLQKRQPDLITDQMNQKPDRVDYHPNVARHYFTDTDSVRLVLIGHVAKMYNFYLGPVGIANTPEIAHPNSVYHEQCDDWWTKDRQDW